MKHRLTWVWPLLLLLFDGCQNDIEVTPAVTTNGPWEYRQAVDTEFEFKVNIAHTISSDVSIDYRTKNGTAVAGIDFIATSGTAIIPSGSLSTTVKVKVLADSLRKDSQLFYLELSNPKNCTITDTEVPGNIDNSNGLYLPVDNTGYISADSYPNYELVWADEFNGKSLYENAWTFDIGATGWGTHEMELYTNRTQNAFISSGNLVIEARKENNYLANFTSARLTTKGKKSFKHGRIDIRAKVPCDQGIMPSLWMLGSNINTVGWPACGEIDIMQLPHTENVAYNTLHWGDSPTTAHQFGVNKTLGIVKENTFHVFSVVWDASQIEMYMDDILTFSMNTSSASLPFNRDFFFIFNVAIGGDWPGSPDSTTKFPHRMVVDYIRVFQ